MCVECLFLGDQVAPTMGALMQADPELSMDAAYDRAVHADPELRASFTAPQRQAERKQEVERAKRASRNVRGDRVKPAPKAEEPAATHRDELARIWDRASTG